MVDQDFPTDVPVCTSTSEKNDAYQAAKDNQRPFLAVTDEEEMPGWRAVYDMDTSGQDREEWYVLSDQALEVLEVHRERFEKRIEVSCVVEGCSRDEGGLHGLSKSDAESFAKHLTDFVWNTDHWEETTLEEEFHS